MRPGYYALCALALLMLLPGCQKREEYPFEQKATFMALCVAKVRAEQAAHPQAPQRDDATVNRLCDCSMQEISRAVPYKDYLAYLNAVNLGGAPDPKTVKAMSEAIATCQVQVYK